MIFIFKYEVLVVFTSVSRQVTSGPNVVDICCLSTYNGKTNLYCIAYLVESYYK